MYSLSWHLCEIGATQLLQLSMPMFDRLREQMDQVDEQTTSPDHLTLGCLVILEEHAFRKLQCCWNFQLQ